MSFWNPWAYLGLMQVCGIIIKKCVSELVSLMH